MSELAFTAPAAPRAATGGPLSRVASDLGTMVGRSLRLSRRNVDGLITAVALPVMLMLMFVYLFGGAIAVPGRYVDYVVPGVLLVSIGFGVGTTAVSVSEDVRGGIVDRFRSLDVAGEALLTGHAVAGLVRNVLSTALTFGVAFAIGYRTPAGAGRWLVAAAVLALWILAVTWLCAALGLLADSPEAANGFSFFVSFLAYPSSAFVPIHTMPSWLQGFARNQPVTQVVDTLRAALSGGPVGATAWHAVVWSLGIGAVCVLAAGALFRRRTR